MSIFDFVSTPKLADAKRVLCVQPHPDDMEVSCGGALAQLADNGTHITYLTVTDGGAGSNRRVDENQLAKKRRKEQRAAGRIIGIQDYLWLPYRDADYLDPAQLQSDIIHVIRQVRPDTVITLDPWLPYEAHPAHRNVGLCAAAAVLFSDLPNISAMRRVGDTSAPPSGSPADARWAAAGNTDPCDLEEGHSVARIVFSLTAKPNTYVDVTDTWDRKMAAIRAHVSQFPDETWAFYGQYFEAKALQYGQLAGVAKAEAVKVLTPMHLHCNVDAAEM